MAVSQQNAASSRAPAIATTPAGLRRCRRRTCQRWRLTSDKGHGPDDACVWTVIPATVGLVPYETRSEKTLLSEQKKKKGR